MPSIGNIGTVTPNTTQPDTKVTNTKGSLQTKSGTILEVSIKSTSTALESGILEHTQPSKPNTLAIGDRAISQQSNAISSSFITGR